MGAVDKILPQLRGLKSRGAGRWMAHCPAHDDKTPSLSIAEGADGRILLRCFADCSAAEIMDSIGLSMSDLYEGPIAHQLRPIGKAGRRLIKETLKKSGLKLDNAIFRCYDTCITP